jgi:hypothetical protein
MAGIVTLDFDSFIQALSSISREEKITIAERIETDLLSEWDEYENSSEVKSRVKESFKEYNSGEVVELKSLLDNEI